MTQSQDRIISIIPGTGGNFDQRGGHPERVLQLGAQLTREYAGCRPHLIGILKAPACFTPISSGRRSACFHRFHCRLHYGNSTTTSEKCAF